MVIIWLVIMPLLQQTVAKVSFSLYSNNSELLRDTDITKEDEIRFLLFTYKNKIKEQEIQINDTECLLKSNFNFNHSTKVIIHGWLSSNNTTIAMENLKDAYVENTTYNIILVDWSYLANDQYKTAVNFVNTVSEMLLEFLKFLLATGVKTKQLHLIGHCLGAHIAGKAGQSFRDHENIIDAITGLDPAFPRFKFCKEDQRISKYNARFVEIVHTNGGYWGIDEPLGHVDFYPNGGKKQPGCEHDKRGFCSHERAIWYYTFNIIDNVKSVPKRFLRYENDHVHFSEMVEIKLSDKLQHNYRVRTFFSKIHPFTNPDMP